MLEKLDGQMITGVLVGDCVEFWSRKGRTVLQTTAHRIVAEDSGDCEGLVRAVNNNDCTAVFEMIGSQSKIKADEGAHPRLVFLNHFWPARQLVH